MAIPLVITLDGSRPMEEVRQDLLQAGFELNQSLDAINVLTGAHPDPAKLKTIAGLADVSEDHPIQLPPPDSPTTF
jgi:hypothetical protein